MRTTAKFSECIASPSKGLDELYQMAEEKIKRARDFVEAAMDLNFIKLRLRKCLHLRRKAEAFITKKQPNILSVKSGHFLSRIFFVF